MSVMHSPESEYAKELTKWEAQGSTLGPGKRPYVKYPYPARVYKAGRIDGKVAIVETMLVDDDLHASNAYSRGWHPDPEAACVGLEAEELLIAKAAAERAFQEQRMSPKAREEAAHVEADPDRAGHLASMPVTPIRRRLGRPPTRPPSTES